jgi:hypothetical protein
MGYTSRKPYSDLSMAKRSRIWTLYEKGHKPTTILKKTNIPRSIVFSFLIRHVKSSTSIFKSKPGRGCKPKLDPRVEKTLVHITIEDTKIIFKVLTILSKSRKQFHYQTIVKVLKKHKKSKYRPRKKPYLNPTHMTRRKEYYKVEKKIRRNNRRIYWSDKIIIEVRENGRLF